MCIHKKEAENYVYCNYIQLNHVFTGAVAFSNFPKNLTKKTPNMKNGWNWNDKGLMAAPEFLPELDALSWRGGLC